jgi:hypothetical protein
MKYLDTINKSLSSTKNNETLYKKRLQEAAEAIRFLFFDEELPGE